MNPARDLVLMILVVYNICKEYYKVFGKNHQGRGHMETYAWMRRQF
jgi:hypothetical protein